MNYYFQDSVFIKTYNISYILNSTFYKKDRIGSGTYCNTYKITKDKVIKFYDTLDRGASYYGKDFDNMYMTSFIQMIIDNLLNVKPTFINGGWIEIDSLDDLKNLEKIDENFNI